MMYELASAEVGELGQKLIEKDHRHLMEANISYLFRDSPWKTGGDGRTILGKAAKRNEIDKLLSQRKEDFIIIIPKPTWDKMSEDERRCVIDHELCHCFTECRTPIFTISGEEAISDVKVGNRVLTHLGRFRKVYKVFKIPKQKVNLVTIVINTDSYKHSYKDRQRKIVLTFTEGHNVLVNGEWIEARNIKVGGIVSNLASTCKKCGIQIPFHRKFCSQSCQSELNMRKHWHNPEFRENLSRSVSAANILQRTGKPSGRKGYSLPESHPFKTGAAVFKSFSTSGKRKRSFAERKFEWGLRQRDINYKAQFPVQKGICRSGALRYYFLDFAIPELKVGIEVDGEFWHSRKDVTKQEERQKFIENNGWQVLRFTDREVKENLGGCLDETQRLISNHKGEFGFINAIVKEVKHWEGTYTLYNLGVEEDESYIAKGIVVHNCGVRVDTGGNKKWMLRKHTIEEFPENLARFSARRDQLGALISDPPSAIVSKPPSLRRIRPHDAEPVVIEDEE